MPAWMAPAVAWLISGKYLCCVTMLVSAPASVQMIPSNPHSRMVMSRKTGCAAMGIPL